MGGNLLGASVRVMIDFPPHFSSEKEEDCFIIRFALYLCLWHSYYLFMFVSYAIADFPCASL